MSDLNIDEIRTTWLDDRIGTHFDTCHLSHYKCAIARLCDEVERLRAGANDDGDAIEELIDTVTAKDLALREAVTLMGELETRYCDLVPMSFPPPMTKSQHEAWLAWCQRRDAFLAKHGGKP